MTYETDADDPSENITPDTDASAITFSTLVSVGVLGFDCGATLAADVTP